MKETTFMKDAVLRQRAGISHTVLITGHSEDRFLPLRRGRLSRLEDVLLETFSCKDMLALSVSHGLECFDSVARDKFIGELNLLAGEQSSNPIEAARARVGLPDPPLIADNFSAGLSHVEKLASLKGDPLLVFLPRADLAFTASPSDRQQVAWLGRLLRLIQEDVKRDIILVLAARSASMLDSRLSDPDLAISRVHIDPPDEFERERILKTFISNEDEASEECPAPIEGDSEGKEESDRVRMVVSGAPTPFALNEGTLSSIRKGDRVFWCFENHIVWRDVMKVSRKNSSISLASERQSSWMDADLALEDITELREGETMFRIVKRPSRTRKRPLVAYRVIGDIKLMQDGLDHHLDIPLLTSNHPEGLVCDAYVAKKALLSRIPLNAVPILPGSAHLEKVTEEGPELEDSLETEESVEEPKARTIPLPSMSLAAFVRATAGLTRTQIADLIAIHAETSSEPTFSTISARKAELLESSLDGLVHLVEPSFGFEGIGGLDWVKNELKEAVRAVKEGRLRHVPMGVLLAGPPGTGKTALAEALARECGFAFVKIGNTRSKWVGESEARQERMFATIRALAPVIVLRDEVDQEDSGRDGYSGDSGVSNRQRKGWMEFLSDPRIQGRVLVVSCTNRPDLIDEALKRSGRTDLRLPVLMPDIEARKAIFPAIAKAQCGIELHVENFKALAEVTEGLSGADIKAILERADRLTGDDPVTEEVLRQVIEDFRPSVDPKTVEAMTYLACRFATFWSQIPESWRARLGCGSAGKDIAVDASLLDTSFGLKVGPGRN